MRDVHLAELAEVAAVGVDHRRRVVVDAGEVLLVDRHDQHDLMLPGDLGHQPGRGAVGHGLGQFVPSRLLLGAEVRAVEQLLQADDLRPRSAALAINPTCLSIIAFLTAATGEVAGSQSVAWIRPPRTIRDMTTPLAMGTFDDGDDATGTRRRIPVGTGRRPADSRASGLLAAGDSMLRCRTEIPSRRPSDGHDPARTREHRDRVKMLIGGRWEASRSAPFGPGVQPVERERHRRGPVLHGRRGRSRRAVGRRRRCRTGPRRRSSSGRG